MRNNAFNFRDHIVFRLMLCFSQSQPLLRAAPHSGSSIVQAREHGAEVKTAIESVGTFALCSQNLLVMGATSRRYCPGKANPSETTVAEGPANGVPTRRSRLCKRISPAQRRRASDGPGRLFQLLPQTESRQPCPLGVGLPGKHRQLRRGLTGSLFLPVRTSAFIIGLIMEFGMRRSTILPAKLRTGPPSALSTGSPPFPTSDMKHFPCSKRGNFLLPRQRSWQASFPVFSSAGLA